MTKIALGSGVALSLRYGNRHGLITGATGTGKSVTVQKLMEGFSAAGVPVFAADVKGDLSGVSSAFPTRFWDIFETEGLPIKTSIHEMGPMVVARLLGLNAVQEGVLNIAYRWLNDPDCPTPGAKLQSLDDLRILVGAMMNYADDLRSKHGNVTSATVGAIQRAILWLEGQGGESLFGEPALDVRDFMRVDANGRGMINLLSADRLMGSPKLYGAFLLWLLLRLFEVLPEAGDLAKPKFVLFIDEAHLLFSEASPALMETIERVVRLIRSKGVGVYFATQHPNDVPGPILAQLSNRVQHALRAFTPRDRKAVKTAADTFRQNKAIDTMKAITEMGVGEALVSFLGDGGVPEIVQRIQVEMPVAQVAPIDWLQRIATIKSDELRPKYGVRFEDQDAMYQALIARLADEDAELARNTKERPTWQDDTDTTTLTADASLAASTISVSHAASSPA